MTDADIINAIIEREGGFVDDPEDGAGPPSTASRRPPSGAGWAALPPGSRWGV